MTERAHEIASALRDAAAEVMQWANGPENAGPFQNEIYIANVQIHAALHRVADKIDPTPPHTGS